MKIQSQIEEKLREGLAPSHLEVLNESHKHKVPPGSETHFKITAVSDRFEGKSLIDRHRMLYGLLSDEIARKKAHALSLHTFTPAEWSKGQEPHAPPPCLGASKHE